LFLRPRIAAGMRIPLDAAQTNYVVNVLRMRAGDTLLVFNGIDGEWRVHLDEESRRAVVLDVEEMTHAQPAPFDLQYLFAPIKHARLDYMVGKAVEMGVGRLRPVLTQHGQVARVNLERMHANAIEAAEQCGILNLPAIDEAAPLRPMIAGWANAEPGRRIIFCDEGHDGADPTTTLAALPQSPLAVLVGPEGGFSAEERELLRAQPFVTALPLGPRILRADTAAVAALALVQTMLGDWRQPPPDRA
jgi:16S rRNA (uracil1498-N3)-methyltransferase